MENKFDLSEYYVDSIYNMIFQQDTNNKIKCLELAKELGSFLANEIKNSQSPILNQTLEQYKYTQSKWDLIIEKINEYEQK